MIKRSKEKIEKMMMDIKNMKESSDSLDLTVFAKKTEVDIVKQTFTQLNEQTKLSCDEK